eukprot:6482411-Amphidinium_carterae.3
MVIAPAQWLGMQPLANASLDASVSAGASAGAKWRHMQLGSVLGAARRGLSFWMAAVACWTEKSWCDVRVVW